MKHARIKPFNDLYDEMPQGIRAAADRAFELLKSNPFHPSLHFKKHGDRWSTRVSAGYRAPAIYDEDSDTYLWYFIGPHHKYDARLDRR